MNYDDLFLLTFVIPCLILAIISFFFMKYFVEIKASIIKKKIKRLWFNSPDEETFKKNIEIFLKNYPAPLSKSILKKDRQILKKIQSFFKNDFLDKKEISSDFYEELIFIIKEKQKELLWQFSETNYI